MSTKRSRGILLVGVLVTMYSRRNENSLSAKHQITTRMAGQSDHPHNMVARSSAAVAFPYSDQSCIGAFTLVWAPKMVIKTIFSTSMKVIKFGICVTNLSPELQQPFWEWTHPAGSWITHRRSTDKHSVGFCVSVSNILTFTHHSPSFLDQAWLSTVFDWWRLIYARVEGV